MDDNNSDSLYNIEAILQKVFTKKELQNMIIYDVTVILMLLDQTYYDQTNISSSKLQERMSK